MGILYSQLKWSFLARISARSLEYPMNFSLPIKDPDFFIRNGSSYMGEKFYFDKFVDKS